MSKGKIPAFPLPQVTFKTVYFPLNSGGFTGVDYNQMPREVELTGEVMILNINSGTMRVRVKGYPYPFNVPATPFFEQFEFGKKE